MARPAKPWFWKERNGWYITLNGKRIQLAQGKQNRKLPTDRFHELMIEVRTNRLIPGRQERPHRVQ
jgi:hypothetical protein